MNSFAGIYELPEAGRYLYVTAPERPLHYSTLHRWVRSGLPLNHIPSIPQNHLFITFEDLVSLRMIIALRVAGFSLQHVRKVHEWLKRATAYPRPFALKDLWISETEIFVEMENFLSATKQGQYTMDFIKSWLKRIRRPQNTLDLTFKKIDGNEVASSWIPRQYVVLDPLVQFGTPCIEQTRIPTSTIWSMYRGGDSLETIAKDYGIPLEKVEAGLEWETTIARIAS